MQTSGAVFCPARYTRTAPNSTTDETCLRFQIVLSYLRVFICERTRVEIIRTHLKA